MSGNKDIVELFLGAGANVHAKDQVGGATMCVNLTHLYVFLIFTIVCLFILLLCLFAFV